MATANCPKCKAEMPDDTRSIAEEFGDIRQAFSIWARRLVSVFPEARVEVGGVEDMLEFVGDFVERLA